MGLLISCAIPPAISPSADIFAAMAISSGCSRMPRPASAIPRVSPPLLLPRYKICPWTFPRSLPPRSLSIAARQYSKSPLALPHPAEIPRCPSPRPAARGIVPGFLANCLGLHSRLSLASPSQLQLYRRPPALGTGLRSVENSSPDSGRNIPRSPLPAALTLPKRAAYTAAAAASIIFPPPVTTIPARLAAQTSSQYSYVSSCAANLLSRPH